MDINTKDEARIYMELFVPDAIRQVMESYNEFMKMNIVDKKIIKDEKVVKSFIEFHKAIKVALSNMEHLLKLHDLIEKNEEVGMDDENIKEKIKRAEKNIIKNLSDVER